MPAAIPASRFQQVEIQRTKGFEPVNDPVVYLKQLVDELTAVATTPAGDDGRSIAFAVTDYEIIR